MNQILEKKYFFPIIRLTILLTLLAPTSLFAAGETLGSIITRFADDLIDPLVGILMTLAILAFFYGLVLYIWNLRGGKDEGKAIMVWGVVAIAVMVSVWGLVNLLQRTVLGEATDYGAPDVDDFLPTE